MFGVYAMMVCKVLDFSPTLPRNLSLFSSAGFEEKKDEEGSEGVLVSERSDDMFIASQCERISKKNDAFSKWKKCCQLTEVQANFGCFGT
jgi:hypothetical protein